MGDFTWFVHGFCGAAIPTLYSAAWGSLCLMVPAGRMKGQEQISETCHRTFSVHILPCPPKTWMSPMSYGVLHEPSSLWSYSAAFTQKQVIPPTTSSPAIIVKHVDETQPAKECSILEEKASSLLLFEPLLQSLANTKPYKTKSLAIWRTYSADTAAKDFTCWLGWLPSFVVLWLEHVGAASKCQGLSTSSGQSGWDDRQDHWQRTGHPQISTRIRRIHHSAHSEGDEGGAPGSVPVSKARATKLRSSYSFMKGCNPKYSGRRHLLEELVTYWRDVKR